MKRTSKLLTLMSIIILMAGCEAPTGIKTSTPEPCYGYTCTACEWIQWHNNCDTVTHDRCPSCQSYVTAVVNE